MAADLQEIVDALSVRLGRPVLVDDLDLRPLAYSTQFGELDSVRTASILGRNAPDAAREALFDAGIRAATELVHIPAHPSIGMAARICVPIIRGPRRLGYLWLIEDTPLAAEELQLARGAASEAAALLQSDADAQLDRRRHEQALIAALLGPDTERAAATLEAERYLPMRPVAVHVAVGDELLDRLRASTPVKHLLCGELGGRAVWLGAADADLEIAVGVGEPVTDLRDAPRSYRHALAALRVAVSGVTRWEDLRAYRLLTALPAAVLDDIPAGLRTLLAGGHEQLVLTLETYLDHAGDVKSTSAALWLHRTSLYYRLRRIEEIAGLDLDRGEDRLLCHVALRLARLGG